MIDDNQDNETLTAIGAKGPEDDFPAETPGLPPAIVFCINKAFTFFENLIKLQLVLRHTIFNEEEAAMYLRCSVESVRYHALRSRKLSFLNFSREGLVFTKADLESFIKNARIEGFRDR